MKKIYILAVLLAVVFAATAQTERRFYRIKGPEMVLNGPTGKYEEKAVKDTTVEVTATEGFTCEKANKAGISVMIFKRGNTVIGEFKAIDTRIWPIVKQDNAFGIDEDMTRKHGGYSDNGEVGIYLTVFYKDQDKGIKIIDAKTGIVMKFLYKDFRSDWLTQAGDKKSIVSYNSVSEIYDPMLYFPVDPATNNEWNFQSLKNKWGGISSYRYFYTNGTPMLDTTFDGFTDKGWVIKGKEKKNAQGEFNNYEYIVGEW